MRSTAAAFGFFTLSQYFPLPDRYGELRRLTMPSASFACQLACTGDDDDIRCPGLQAPCKCQRLREIELADDAGDIICRLYFK